MSSINPDLRYVLPKLYVIREAMYAVRAALAEAQ
jgi:hypothetical protein